MSNVQLAIAGDDTTQVILSVPGVQGPAGQGVPSGGTTNQVLFKQSGTNYDTAWGAITSAMIGDLQIVNADVSASAAIAGTKISPNFGSQNVITTGTSTAASFTPTSSTVPTNGVYLSAANSVALSTNGTGRLFINASGNVTINNTTGADPGLTVKGSASTAKVESVTNTANLDITNSTQTTRLGAVNADFAISHAGSERLRITSAGLVGIGTSAPVAQLDVRSGASGFSQFYHASGDGGVRIVGSGPGSLANLVFANNFNTSPIDRYTIKLDGFDQSLKFLSGGPSATARMTLLTGGNVGIGTTSPSDQLHLSGGALRVANAIGYGATFANTSSPGMYITLADTISSAGIGCDSGALTLRANGNTTERARIDSSGTFRVKGAGTAGVNDAVQLNGSAPANSLLLDASGRLLVGTSSTFSFVNTNATTVTPKLQLAGLGEDASSFGLFHFTTGSISRPSSIAFARSQNGTVGQQGIVADGAKLGEVSFHGSDGIGFIHAANIRGEVDGTPGANDMPGRLVFSVTQDGSASPTEALRISSNRAITVSDGGNVVLGTTTGTKIGTATTQKLGFYNATPVVQPAAVADATDAASVITQLNDLLSKLRTLGIIAT